MSSEVCLCASVRWVKGGFGTFKPGKFQGPDLLEEKYVRKLQGDGRNVLGR